MPLLLSALLALGAASADHKAEAKTEADRAMVLYRVGKFEESLASFTHAYELFQAPGLLFNLGQCHRELGHHRLAVFFYAEYVRENPGAPNREQVEALLADERAQQRLENVRPHGQAAPGLSAPTSAPVATSAMTQKWWFWTAIGSGTAVVVAAVITGVVLAQPHAAVASSTLGVLDRQ